MAGAHLQEVEAARGLAIASAVAARKLQAIVMQQIGDDLQYAARQRLSDRQQSEMRRRMETIVKEAEATACMECLRPPPVIVPYDRDHKRAYADPLAMRVQAAAQARVLAASREQPRHVVPVAASTTSRRHAFHYNHPKYPRCRSKSPAVSLLPSAPWR